MKIVLLAGSLVALAALALGASLAPMARVTPISVSVGAPGAPEIQVPAVAAQPAPAVKAPAPANSIARSAESQAEPAAPVIPAPPPARSTGTSTDDGMGPQIEAHTPIRCVVGHGDKKKSMCPPLPAPEGD